MTEIYDEKKTVIVNNPVATEQSNMNIVASQKNYYGDDPLLNACFVASKLGNKDLLEKKYKLIIHLIRKDTLKLIIEKKMVDREVVYKKIFERISNYLEGKINEEFIIDNIIDDGYNSIINSIVGIAIVFKSYNIDNNSILVNGNEDIFCNISTTTLNIQFSNEIRNRNHLIEVDKFAKILEEKLRKITRINDFYSIYNFNQIQINNSHISNLNFINEEIKYRVATKIIPNLIKPLYGDKPECGAREIIQNATDACKERSCLASKNKEIYEPRVDINYNNDVIRICDNGIGMDIDIIRNNYFYVGNSTKSEFEGSLVGQFGIGSLASFLLGDEISIRTKRYGQDNILEFKYILSKDADDVIDVFINADKSFDSGTEITIVLNQKLKDKANNLAYKLKLKEWYLTSEIPIYINGEKIPNINKENAEWIEFKRISNEFVAEFLYDKKDLGSNLDLDRRIIYNGILLSEPYSINKDYQVNIKTSPCINIEDIGIEKKMNVNLERSRFTNINYIMEDLKSNIYKKELNDLKLRSPILIDRNNPIWEYKYDGRFIDGMPIIYSSFGAAIDCVYTRSNLHKSGIEKLVKLYNCNNIKFNDLDSRYAYIFSNENIGKAFVGDKIISQRTRNLYVYRDFMENYFFQADNWSNGLKTDALKEIYRYYKNYLEVDTSLAPTKFWQQHNIYKKILKNIIMKEDGNIFFRIKDEISINNELINRIFEKNKYAVIECQDTLYTNIVCIDENFDYYYNKIFNDSLFIWQWT